VTVDIATVDIIGDVGIDIEPQHQGSMLWSQFYAIFPNFRRTNWRFS
jgi:hypothetical protein